MCFSGWSKNRVRLTLLDGLFPVRYSSTKVVINGLPESIRGCPAKLTSYRLDMQHSNEERVLSIAACQKLQKIDRQRYILDLSQEEIALLDHIDRSTTTVVMGHEGTFHATVGVKEHGIYLLVLEAH